MRTNLKRKHGFTLIELLVVIVLLGVLASLGIPSFLATQKKSRDSKRKGDVAMIAKALEMYYNDNNAYPVSNGGKIVVAGSDVTWGSPLLHPTPAAATTYMSKLPLDPKYPAYTYYYVSPIPSGAGFYLFARLENTDDPEAAKSGGSAGNYGNSYACVNVLMLPGSKANCNYIVSSANANPPATVAD